MDLTATNPILRSPHKLKLGVFSFNGDASRTLAPDRYQFSWENSLDVAEQADRYGLDAIVPYARFKSIVNPRHHTGYVFENLTWSAAVAARTRHSCVMSTLHVSNMHPVIAAKAITTIDHISGGRFGLNMVCGWFKEESEMCGNVFLDHDERYAHADEWITVVKRLWSEDDEVNFDGKYIQIKGGMSQPKPIQKPRPLLMNAGSSEAGKAFVAKHCDMAFIRVNSFEAMQKEAQEYRKAAFEYDGRNLQIWIIGAVVQGDSMSDAARLADHYAEHLDEGYLDTILDYKKQGLTPETRKALKKKYAFAGTGLPLVGDAGYIARQLQELSDQGIDGVLLTWIDYQNGIRRFGEEVLPLLAKSGARRAADVSSAVA